MHLVEATEVIKTALKQDKALFDIYKKSIAMSFINLWYENLYKGKVDVHLLADEAAETFLNNFLTDKK